MVAFVSFPDHQNAVFTPNQPFIHSSAFGGGSAKTRARGDRNSDDRGGSPCHDCSPDRLDAARRVRGQLLLQPLFVFRIYRLSLPAASTSIASACCDSSFPSIAAACSPSPLRVLVIFDLVALTAATSSTALVIDERFAAFLTPGAARPSSASLQQLRHSRRHTRVC